MKDEFKRTILKSLYIYPVLIILLVIYSLPILWLFSSSFKSESTYTKDQFTIRAFLLTEFRIENYLFVIQKGGLGRAVLNTVWVAFLNIVFCGLVNSFAAFSLAYLNYPMKRFIFGLIIALIIIPFDALILQNFITIKNLGLLNTYASMVLPGLANPFFIFLYRQFFLNIPKEIFESARIDGAGYLSIYFRIVFPIAKPVFTLTSISIFNGMWNAFLWPLMVITNPKYNLIQIAVQKFLGSRTLDTGYIMASLSISALPPLILFAFLQRYFVAAMRGIAK